MLRQRDGHGRDRVLERGAQPRAFLVDGAGRIKGDRLADKRFFQRWRVVDRDEGESLARLPVIEARQVDELVLKFVQNVVISLVLFREDDHGIAFAQLLDRGAVGRDQARVVINGDRARIVEQQYGQRRDHIAEHAEKRAAPARLEGPEIRVGIGGNLAPAHHFPGAPGVVFPRKIELGDDRAIHLRVVAHNDAGLVGQLVRADDLRPAVKQADQRADEQIQGISVLSLLHVKASSKCRKLICPRRQYTSVGRENQATKVEQCMNL